MQINMANWDSVDIYYLLSSSNKEPKRLQKSLFYKSKGKGDWTLKNYLEK